MFRATKFKKMTIIAISLSALLVMSPTVFAQSGGVSAEIDALKSAVTSLQSTVSKLEQLDASDIANLKNTVSALGIQEQADANDIKSLKQSIATQATQIADLQNTVNSQAAVIAQLNQAVSSIENRQIKLLVNFPSNGVQTNTPNVWAYDAYFQLVNGVGQSINIDYALDGITLTVTGQIYQVTEPIGPGVFYIRHNQDSGMQPNEYHIVFYTNTASLSKATANIGGIPYIGTFTTPVF